MTSQILTTKLFVPSPGPYQVSRPRLLTQLQSGSTNKLTIISAPAGYGKTTLISEWINQAKIPFAWISLDQHDNDLKRFLSYIIASLQSIRIEVDNQIFNPYQSQQLDHFTTILIPLINQISAAVRRFALVLDDYHLIQSQEIHEALTYLIDNLPQKMRLVIATRTDPPLRLAQLRACGELCEIRSEDLRFTIEEATLFLNRSIGLNLAPSDITTLSEKTEGWITGLQLAAISLQKHLDKHKFVAAFAGDDRYIADYLLDEALRHQPIHIQTFLLQTSILDRLSAPLCDAVIGRVDSHGILMEIERANLFLLPIDNQRHWYRYHHLFAELLKNRLMRTMTNKISDLYQRTSAWHEGEGLISQAAFYALEGGDLKGVSRLVEGNSFALVDTSELTVLSKQLDILPTDVFRTDPWITLAKAWVRAFTGQWDTVEPLLNAIEKMIEGIDEPDSRRILGRVNSLKVYIAGSMGNFQDSIKLAQKALDQLPKDDFTTRGFTLSLMGNRHRDKGNLRTAVKLLNEAVLVARTANDRIMSVMTLCRLVAAQRMIGSLNQAEGTCQEALELAEEYHSRTGKTLPILPYAQFRMGEILYEKNDLENAFNFVQDGLSLSRNWGHFDVLLLGLRIKTNILLGKGDKEGALDSFQKRSQVVQRLRPQAKWRNLALEADIRLTFGNLGWVDDWAASNELDIQDEIRYQDYYFYFILLRFLMAKEKLVESEILLNRLLDLVECSDAAARIIDLLAMHAVIFFENGNLDDALVVLNQALDLAAPEGFVRKFLNLGEPMAQLLYQAALKGIRPEFCNQILGQFSTTLKTGVTPHDEQFGQLSDREIEVLKFIAQGSTNQEIAQELILSLHTVKSHARNIYSKLGVKNRTEAVARARLLGLLPQD